MTPHIPGMASDFASDYARRATAARRRGYLIRGDGTAWKVPDDLLDIYREEWPDLGTETPGDSEREPIDAPRSSS